MNLTIPQRSTTAHGAAYITAGGGEPLVLIHGVGLRLEAWTPQIEAFSATHRVIALDLPGHGQSALLAEGARIPEFVVWLKQAIDDLGCGPVNLCGHSMGALITLGFSLTHPDLVRRAALICGVYKREAAARDAVMARAREIAVGHRDVEGPLARWYRPQRSPEEAQALAITREWLSTVSHEGYATAYRAFAEGDRIYADRLSELNCPVLFLTGEFDPNSTPRMVAEMAAAAPNSRAVVVRDEKHMVHLVAPEPVNTALRTWLANPPNNNLAARQRRSER